MQIIDGTLKLIIQMKNFSQWSRKGKVKGSKDFTLLYTCAYIPKSQFITDHTKEIAETILRTFENVPALEILVAEKALEQSNYRALEQKKMLSIFCH